MGIEVGDVNMYDIYADCISGSSSRNGANRTGGSPVWRVPRTNEPNLMRALRRLGLTEAQASSKLGGPDECIDGIDAEAYLNSASVQTAIHVQQANQQSWTICTSIPYSGNTDSLLPLYPTLIARYRTLIYNGDVDACVPYTDNEVWTSGLGFDVAQGWRAWAVNGQVAGYVTTYNVNNFTFLTVKGAGHVRTVPLALHSLLVASLC